MTRKDADGDDQVRIAELEAQNEQLKEQLAKREHDTAEIADALEAAQKSGSNGTALWQPKVYMGLLGFLIMFCLYMSVWLPLDGFPGLAEEVLFIGFCFVLLGKWLRAERGINAGVYVAKVFVMAIGLFVTALIASESRVLQGHMEPVLAPFWAMLWVLGLMAVMMSPFCEWAANSIADFVQHPAETSRGWFARNSSEQVGESYDGFREN
jgi:hypothetical protein